TTRPDVDAMDMGLFYRDVMSIRGGEIYAGYQRHISGLIGQECLHFKFHKFCQGARAGTPSSSFKCCPMPSISLPSNSSLINSTSVAVIPMAATFDLASAKAGVLKCPADSKTLVCTTSGAISSEGASCTKVAADASSKQTDVAGV